MICLRAYPPRRVRARWSESGISGHAVKTVSETAWRGSKDGSLLTYAQEQFDVFVTIDRKLERQHNVAKLKLGFVLVRVPNNEIGSYHTIFAELQKTAQSIKMVK